MFHSVFSGTWAQDFEAWLSVSKYVKFIILKLFSIVISFVRVAEIIGEYFWAQEKSIELRETKGGNQD